MTIVAIALFGFFLGMRHATDPDHVIAVTTIVSRHGSVRRAAAIGIVWGLGHTLTITVVGGAIILFDLVISVRVGLSMEFAVALMLIALGVVSFSSALRSTTRSAGEIQALGAYSHPRRHDDDRHAHPNIEDGRQPAHAEPADPWLDRKLGRKTFYATLRPLVVGIVHGLAGSAAVALLVLTTVHSAGAALAYLLVFGLGTIVGMMLITATVSVPFAFASRRLRRLNGFLGIAAALVSLLFGFFLAYRVGVVQGLFSQHPIWTPG